MKLEAGTDELILKRSSNMCRNDGTHSGELDQATGAPQFLYHGSRDCSLRKEPIN